MKKFNPNLSSVFAFTEPYSRLQVTLDEARQLYQVSNKNPFRGSMKICIQNPMQRNITYIRYIGMECFKEIV